MFRKSLFFFLVFVTFSFFVKRDNSAVLNPYEFDEKVLKKAIVDLINGKRLRYHRPIIESDSKLDSLIEYFHKEYKNKDFYKIRKKLRKGFYEKGIELGLNNSWFKVAYGSYSTMPTFGRNYFFDSNEQIYKYGTKSALKDTVIIPKHTRLITYNELAKKLIYNVYPGKVRRWVNNPAVTKIGLYLKVSKRNFPNRVPSVSIMYVLSGNVMPKVLK